MRFRYKWRDQVYEINLEQLGSSYQAMVSGRSYIVDILDAQPGQLSLMMNNRPVTMYYAQEGDRKWVSMDGCTYLLEKPSPHASRRRGEGELSAWLRAPMPAQVRSIEILAGDQVERGQTLLLLEAMKMEIRIKAPRSGVIKNILVEPDQTVDRDQSLIEMGD